MANVPRTRTLTSGQPMKVWLPLPCRRVFTLTMAMAEEHLYGPEVGAVFKQVSRQAVGRVWGDTVFRIPARRAAR